MTPPAPPADDAPPGGTAAGETPPRVHLFVNPRAGSWRCRQVAALRSAFEAAGAVVTLVPGLDALAASDDVDHVCAVGGDGTVRDIVAVLRGFARPPSLSVYPLGTVNLLARECGYTERLDAFVARALVRPVRRRHHVALIGDVPMLTCASVGADSAAIDILSPRAKRLVGRYAYALAFCAVFARWPRHRLRLTTPGREIACEAVYVANGRFFAGPWSFAPTAAVDEPLLHVVALPRTTRVAVLRFAWELFRHREPHGVIRFTCTALTIDAPATGDAGDVPVQGDGDIVARLPVEIRIAPETFAFA